MPGTIAARGNELYDFVIGPTLTPAATAATTTAEQTFTVPGIQANDIICGCSFQGAWTVAVDITNVRTATNQIIISFSNSTAGSLTAPSGQYVFEVIRLEVSALSQLPTTAI